MALLSAADLFGEPDEPAPPTERRSALISAADLRGEVDEPEEPGLLAKAANIVKGAATTVAGAIPGAAAGAPIRALLTAAGPAITPGDVPSLATPKPAPAPATPRAIGAGPDQSVAFPGQSKNAGAPIPINILKARPPLAVAGAAFGGARGAEMGAQAAEQERRLAAIRAAEAEPPGPPITSSAEAVRDAEALERRFAMQDARERARVFRARPVGHGDEERGLIGGAVEQGLEATGLLDRRQVDERRRQQQAAEAVLRIVAGEQGQTVGEFRQPGPRALEQAALGAANTFTLGVGKQVLRSYGFEEPEPETIAEGLARGAGELGGFVLGPAKLAHRLLEGRVAGYLTPAAGDAVEIVLAKNVANQAATLGLASTLSHAGDLAESPTLVDALKTAAGHAKGGALLGAVFGGVGGTIQNRAARMGVGLAAIDAVQGTHSMDERAWAQKAFDYGLNVFFLWKGQDPRAMQRLLEAEAKARTEEARAQTKDSDTVKPVAPEEVLKSALDIAQERAAAKTKPEMSAVDRGAVLRAELRTVFAEEVGDPATGTTASELRSARHVAEEQAPYRPAPKLAEVILPGRPEPSASPVMIFGSTGRPLAPAVPREGLEGAAERAAIIPSSEGASGLRAPAVASSRALLAELAESFRISGGSGDVVGEGARRTAPAPLDPKIRAQLDEYGVTVFNETPKNFPAWARRMVDDVGPRVAPHLPDLWGRLLREQARTAADKPVAGADAARPAGEGTSPRPPNSARRAESKGPRDSPPPLIEEIFNQEWHQRTVKVATDLFVKGGVEWKKETPLSDQILGMLKDGSLTVPEMAAVLGKHGMTFADFGAELFRPGVRDAARRLGALGQLARKIKEANLPPEVLGDLRQREPEVDEALRAMSWWKRANNVRRGLLVTQLGTAVRNFESQVGRVGIDVLDQGLQGALQRTFGKGQTRSATAAFGELVDVLGQLSPGRHKAMREKVDAILEAFPKETGRLFDSYMSDVNQAAKRDGAAGKVDAAFDKADAAVDILNVANRFQEYVVRRAVFAGELEQALRGKGKDLDAIVRENRVGAIDVDAIKQATAKALEITYAESPAYGSIGHTLMKTMNDTPLSLVFPFPRFMMNSIKFLYEFSPMGALSFLSKAERQRFANGDMRLISRATIGTAMFLAAWAIREYAGGEKWYEVQLPGMERSIDVRPFNPFAAYFFMADIAKRTKDGTLYKLKAADLVKGLLSVNVRAGLGSYTLDKMVEGLAATVSGGGSPEDLRKLVAGGFGHLVAGLLTPLQTFSDFYASIDPDAAIVRSTEEAPFTGPIKQRIPGLAQTLPEAYSPTHAGPIRREAPGVRQLTGLTLTSAKNELEKELDRLQFDYQEIFTSTGDRRADNLVKKAMGPLVDEYAYKVFEAPYLLAGDAEKALMLRRIMTVVRARAKAIAKREDPELFREVAAKRRPLRERLASEETEERGLPLPSGVRRR